MLGNYPDQEIDPKLKGKDFILQYFRAAWQDAGQYLPMSTFYNGRLKYREVRQYAMGKQPIDKYKKILLGDETIDKTWLNNNWNIYPIIPKYREIIISKLMQREIDIQAYAIDVQSQSEEDKYFAEIRTKMIMREAAMQASPKLAQSPVLQKSTNEPDDLEQLNIEAQFGYKSNFSIMAENAINFVLQSGSLSRERKKEIEATVDFGVAGFYYWINQSGMVEYKAVDPQTLITSYCKEPDFSDLQHWGQVEEVVVADLAPYFTPSELNEICSRHIGLFGNPNTLDIASGIGNYARFKCQVMVGQFLSWNTTVFEDKIDSRGNKRFMKTDFSKVSKANVNNGQVGDGTPIYTSTKTKVVYQGRWIIGTDFMYDYGLAKNQKRKASKWWDTSLDICLYAWNFDRMMFTGITERLIPCADDYQLTKMRLAHLKMKLIPYLINLDLDALENVALSKGGKDMEPAQLIDFMLQNNVVLYRSKGVGDGNPNYKPASIEASGMLQAFPQLYTDLMNTLQEIQNISGFNSLTDGTSVNPKMLNGVAQMQESGTNNAMYLLMDADRYLLLELSNAILLKLQIAVKLGNIEGYARALGTNAVKIFKLAPEISAREFAIFLEDVPTTQERNDLIQQLNLRDQKGLIDPSDYYMIMNTRDLKQAQATLAYKIKKRRDDQQKMALEQQKANGQIQIQSAQSAEQMKQQTSILMHKLKVEELNITGQWNYAIAELGQAKVINAAQIAGQAKTVAAMIAADAKKNSEGEGTVNHSIPSIIPIQVPPPPPMMQQQPQQQMPMQEGSPEEQTTDTGGEMPNESQEQQYMG